MTSALNGYKPQTKVFNYLYIVEQFLFDVVDVAFCSVHGQVAATELHQGQAAPALVHQQLQHLLSQRRNGAAVCQHHILTAVDHLHLKQHNINIYLFWVVFIHKLSKENFSKS